MTNNDSEDEDIAAHARSCHFIPFVVDMAQSVQNGRHDETLLWRADMLWRASSAPS